MLVLFDQEVVEGIEVNTVPVVVATVVLLIHDVSEEPGTDPVARVLCEVVIFTEAEGGTAAVPDEVEVVLAPGVVDTELLFVQLNGVDTVPEVIGTVVLLPGPGGTLGVIDQTGVDVPGSVETVVLFVPPDVVEDKEFDCVPGTTDRLVLLPGPSEVTLSVLEEIWVDTVPGVVGVAVLFTEPDGDIKAVEEIGVDSVSGVVVGIVELLVHLDDFEESHVVTLDTLGSEKVVHAVVLFTGGTLDDIDEEIGVVEPVPGGVASAVLFEKLEIVEEVTAVELVPDVVVPKEVLFVKGRGGIVELLRLVLLV